jgi:hypothetical protein
MARSQFTKISFFTQHHLIDLQPFRPLRQLCETNCQHFLHLNEHCPQEKKNVISYDYCDYLFLLLFWWKFQLKGEKIVGAAAHAQLLSRQLLSNPT